MGLAEFVVMFRETFEIALVVGIMLACLYRTKNGNLAPLVYLGAALAIAASIAAAAAFGLVAGGFEGNEALFEGLTMVVASLLVTWLIMWMLHEKNMANEVRHNVKVTLEHHQKLGLVAYSFISVFREGVEIILFLAGIGMGKTIDALSAALGSIAAIVLTYAVLRHMIRLDIGKFFMATTAMLVLLSAGLLSQGVHELQEAGAMPALMERIYDITPQASADGSYPAMHEKGWAGSMLKALVGYDTSPSLGQAAAYIGYIAIVCLFYMRAKRRA